MDVLRMRCTFKFVINFMKVAQLCVSLANLLFLYLDDLDDLDETKLAKD